MEQKAARDRSESPNEDFAVDGLDQHRFYNEELEVKTQAIQD